MYDVWDCPKDPESQHHGFNFSISETQKLGIVPELSDCPRSLDSPGLLGLSHWPRVPTQWRSFLNPRTLRPSEKPETVLGSWDCHIDPGSQHHGFFFSNSETQNPGTIPELWYCPRSPGQSLGIGTVQKTQHYRVYFLIWETQKNGTVQGLWDCPRSLEQT